MIDTPNLEQIKLCEGSWSVWRHFGTTRSEWKLVGQFETPEAAMDSFLDAVDLIRRGRVLLLDKECRVSDYRVR